MKIAILLNCEVELSPTSSRETGRKQLLFGL